MGYARGTRVPVERSQVELERLLAQHGAQAFYRGFDSGRAMVGFRLADRHVKFELPLPVPDEFRSKQRHEQAVRERWRALVLTVKAKLVGVESGVETFEEAFLAHIVTPNKQTVYEHLKGYLATSYREGKMPPLLPGAGETSR